MTDTTPLYEQTLSDLLLQARRGVQRAEARAERARREAHEQVMRSQHQAALAVAQAHARADRAIREERVRRALLADQIEAEVRHALVDVPPLPPLVGRVATPDGPPVEVEQEAPPVPSMAELMRPTPGVTRFLDALLGPPQA